jgi:hypothetical protein
MLISPPYSPTGDDGGLPCLRQVAEIPSFRTSGVKIEPPAWLTTINTPDYNQLKTVLNVGECAVATVTEISYRLGRAYR